MVSQGKSGAAHVGRGAASEDDVAGATASEDDTMAAVDKRAMKGGWTAASGGERGARAGR